MLKMTTEFAFPAGSLLCATIGAVYDVRSRRIPNFITLPAIVFGLLLHAVFGGWRQLVTAAAGGLICGLIFFVFYLAGGMGAGDVKLITAAGCIAGLLAYWPSADIDRPGGRSHGNRPSTLSPPTGRNLP